MHKFFSFCWYMTEHEITAGKRYSPQKNTAYQGIIKFTWKKYPGEGLVN